MVCVFWEYTNANEVPHILDKSTQDKETYSQVIDEEKEETEVTLTSITVKYVDIESPGKIRAEIALLA